MITLNNYFDKIYCINLDEATDRWEDCVKQFKKYNIEVERFSAIKPETGINNIRKGELGLLRSNIEIIKKAKEANYKNILILEDDFEFIDNFNELFDKMIKLVPENWDFLYFGGNHQGGFQMINENVAKIFHTYATHTFAIKNTLFDQLLINLQEENKPVDVYYALIMRQCNSYVFRPHISFQKNGYSYINDADTNYDFLRK